MEGGVDDNNVNVDDDDAGMEGGVDDNNVNVDDDVCDDNNKGEGDCGEGENKDEVGDENNKGEGDCGEFYLPLKSKSSVLLPAGSKFKQRLTYYSGVVLMTTN